MIWRCDLAPQYLALRAEIDAVVAEVGASGLYVLGKQVAAFEREFADYVGVEHGVGVNSGTDALVLALRLSGVSSGDEVITTAFTAIPTYSAIRQVGAVPRLVDIDRDTFLMDLDKLGAAVSARTRAVVAVHLFGSAVDVDAIRQIVGAGITVVEDCAQAHGATVRGRKVGGLGDIAAFSFYPTKNLGALGDGGMILTRDPATAAAARRMRMYGMVSKDEFIEDGVNTRLDELQAAILRVKLKHLDRWNARRATLADSYAGALEARHFVAQRVPVGVQPVHHVFSGVCARDRDGVIAALERDGIQSNVYYPMPLNRQRGYRGPEAGVVFEAAEDVCRRIIALPMYPELPDEVPARVANVMNAFFQSTPQGVR